MIEVISFDKITKKTAISDIDLNSKNSKWINLVNPSKDELKKIQEKFKINKTTIEDLTPSKTRPKIEQFENYNLIIIYNIESIEGKIKTNQVSIILGKNYLITSMQGNMSWINELKKDKDLIKSGPDFLLHSIIGKIIENFFPVIENFDNELDKLQNEALKNPTPAILERLFKIKRELLKLRRIIFPQRETIANLSTRTYINEEVKSYFRDTYDHMIIITDLVEDQRETISSILEVHLSVTSNKLNEIMKVLTVISTVLMPLTLIASIYGMNFKFMPELQWRYGYFVILGIMALVLVLTIIFLKRKKWM